MSTRWPAHRIGVGPLLAAVKHAYTHFRITLTAFGCTLREGIPAGSPWRWAGTGELEELPFSKADRLIARSVAPQLPHEKMFPKRDSV